MLLSSILTSDFSVSVASCGCFVTIFILDSFPGDFDLTLTVCEFEQSFVSFACQRAHSVLTITLIFVFQR